MLHHSLRFALAVLLVFVVMAPAPAWACGESSDCAVPGGSYRIALAFGKAAAAGQKTGAIVYLHGYQQTPADVMQFSALRDVAERLDVALIAPRGRDKSWELSGVFKSSRDDAAFVDAVVADAVARFPIDNDRIMVSGFSVGASMVWYIACARGQRYAGYAPVAGSFWEPYVEDCAMPLATIHHVHGLADRTVPMAGRQISEDATQGNTYKSFALLRRFSACQSDLQGPSTQAGELSCSRQHCGGGVQELCLHDGGHSIEPQWIERAWSKVTQPR